MTYYVQYSGSNSNQPQIISDGGGSTAYLRISENQRFVTDVETFDTISSEKNGRLSYYIVGGADKNLFEIDRKSGKIYFKNAPDFENPNDYGRNNRYQVKVKVVDGAGYIDTQTLDIEIKDVFEGNTPGVNDPSIISNGGGAKADIHVNENERFVTDIETFDKVSSEQNGRLSYFIVGGADKNLFEIDKKSGKVYFKDAPDFEKPYDSNGDNNYEVKVKVVDGAG